MSSLVNPLPVFASKHIEAVFLQVFISTQKQRHITGKRTRDMTVQVRQP